MTNLNLDLDYFDHPKTKRLVGLLGRGSEVLPIKLWCWCAKYHADNGMLAGYSAQEIESVIGWWGESGKMVEAMVKVGYLESNEVGFYVHDFTERNGHIAMFKRRAQTAAAVRWGNPPPESNATSIAKASVKHSPNLPSNKQTIPTPPAGVPDSDLEKQVYDRIGSHKRLSLMDWQKILELRRKYPDRFDASLDELHSGVSNVPKYLEKVLQNGYRTDPTSNTKTCHEHDYTWDVTETRSSLCPKCYPPNTETENGHVAAHA